MKIGQTPFQPIVPKLSSTPKKTEEIAAAVETVADPKQALKKSVQHQIAEMEAARNDMGEDDPKAQQLIDKFKSGKKLTAEEMAYLRRNAPGMMETIDRITREREVIELSMKMARSKTDVQMVAFNASKQIEKHPNPEEREIRAKHLADAKHEYEQTDEYKEKPNSPLDDHEKRLAIRYKPNRKYSSEIAKVAYEQVKLQKRESAIQYEK